MKWFSDLLSRIFGVAPDPKYHCPLYRDCAHVDGPLCHVPTCPERKAAMSAQAGEPPEGEFFAFDPEGGNAFYKTRQEAINHAKESLKYYRDGANDHGEWDEDVEHVRWGVVMQRAKATNISATEDGESSCDYELQDVATRPAPVENEPVGEPFGYFRALPFGWEQCGEHDDGAVALYTRPAPDGFVWPSPPPRRGQSPVLFDDGYEEGWAKCLDAVKAALTAAQQGAERAKGVQA